MKNIILSLFISTFCLFSLTGQTIFIDLVNNDCPEPDILTLCLGENDRYVGQYRYRTFDHTCGDEVITGTLRIYRDQQGDYFLDDFSFGTWPFCYGIEAPRGTLRFNVDCSAIFGISGTDNYGDVWGTEEVVYTDSSFVIKWFNSFPEFGTTELTPLDGRPIGEPGSSLIPEYSIEWSTDETSQTILVTDPGRYDVKVTTPEGDVLYDFIIIPEDSSAFDPMCSGEVIEVSYFIDKNGNAILDGDESLIATGEKYIELSPEYEYLSYESQFYERYVVEPGRYRFTDIHPNLNLSDPNIFVDVFADSGIVPIAIGLVTDNLFTAADVHMSALHPERCNRVVPFRISVINTGSTAYNDQLILYKDSLMRFVSADPSPSEIDDEYIAWDISLEEHGDKQSISLLLKMPDGDFTGEIFCLSPSGGNNEKSNSDYCFELLCAYDPNDKHGTPFRGDRNLCLFEEELKYTIRFENLGNDTAFDVRIEDQLHGALNISSFKLLHSSHEVSSHYIDLTRVLHIYFDNILLPSKEQDTLANKGFVQFSIKTIEGLPEESIINNTAGIFFDFNDPIITNETRHTFVSEFGTTSTNDIKERNEDLLNIWPNPSNGILNLSSIKTEFDPVTYQIVDWGGRLLKHGQVKNGKVSVFALDTGYYFIKVFDSEKENFAIKGFIRL